VLAATPTVIYALAGIVRTVHGLEDAVAAAQDRPDAPRDPTRRHFSYREIDVVDITTGTKLSVEAQNIGLGINKFLAGSV